MIFEVPNGGVMSVQNLKFGNLDDIILVKNFEFQLVLEARKKIDNDVCEYIEEGERLGLEMTDLDYVHVEMLESAIPDLDSELGRICRELSALEAERRYILEQKICR